MSKLITNLEDNALLKDFYYPIDCEFITLGSPLPANLYSKVKDKYELFLNSGQAFTEQHREQLKKAKIPILYLFCHQEKDIKAFYEANLQNIISNPKVSTEQKTSVLYECALGIAHDIFERPTSPEAFQRSKQVVDHTIDLIAGGSDAFLKMISLSSHDYYTYTHSVNVLTFTVGLLDAVGVKDPQLLKEAGMGAFLHDVGKSKVPLTVLNKAGPLTEEEWGMMKKHPEHGLELLEKNPMPERAKLPVIQHHERFKGGGYPHNLKGDQIQLISQAVSLADAYDAMTSNRVYQKARKPFEVFKIIKLEMTNHFKEDLVDAFIKILNFK